jgi:hypothetical protein
VPVKRTAFPIAAIARMCSATTSQKLIRSLDAALRVSAFVLAATAGGFRLALLLMIGERRNVTCVLPLPAHSLHE